MTSQSSHTVRSPRASRSYAARRERPTRRWISTVRPPWRPERASRCMRSPVEAGSIPYSAVIQPRPEPMSQRGTPSSTVAVQRTLVRPKEISTEPCACSTKSGTMSIGRSSSARRPSLTSSRQLEVADGDLLDPGDRQLQEALAERAELVRLPCREEAGRAFPRGFARDALAVERLRHLARCLLGREDQSRRPPEDTLEHRPDERVMRAPEDDRVHTLVLERTRVLSHRRVDFLGGGTRFDQGHEARTGGCDDLCAGVERAYRLRVAAARHRRLGGQHPDPAVAGRLHGRVCLGSEHADDRDGEPLLELRQGCGRGGVARGHDQLHAGVLEISRDLVREALDSLPRARAVGTTRAVAEVDEVLVRQRDETLMKDGEASCPGVEDADRPVVHEPDSTSSFRNEASSLGCNGRRQARTQGARVSTPDTRATEDAAWRRVSESQRLRLVISRRAR